MFKKLKIGVKISIGFGILITIAVILGIMTMGEMENVQSGAERLASEYVPEVRAVYNIERNSLLTMYEMRGYAFSNEEDYLKRGREYLEAVKTSLAKSRELADKYEGLSQLKEGAEAAEEKVREYQELVEKTYTAITAIQENRNTFDTAAVRFMENAEKFYRDQHKLMENEINAGAFKPELLDRLKKIELVDSVIDTVNTIRIANFKSQLLRDPDGIQNALKLFDKVEQILKEIGTMTRNEANLREIAGITESAQKYKAAMTELLENLRTLQQISDTRYGVASDVLNIAREISAAGMGRMVNVTDHALTSVSDASRGLIIGFFIAMLIGVLAAVVITLSITRPIRKITAFTRQFGKGDLNAEIDIDGADEIGEMAIDLNGAVLNLRNIIQELADTTDRLTFSSRELSSLSDEMASSAEEMSSQAGMAASASEQVNASVETVASSVEESSASLSDIASKAEEMSSASDNVAMFGKKTSENVADMARSSEEISEQINTVASATEEMTVSLNEAAKHTAQASRISKNASRGAGQINSRMNTLVASSKKIGRIVEVIKDIADQTNMLALNATIEAAGAGEAGKGFAVVAGEVKELAKQSADATEEIAGQIEDIQASTRDVVQAIEDINKVINEIADINEMIAASVEEQTATASEISKSVASTAATVKNVAKKANESANLVEDIARSARDSSKTVAQVAQNIDELLNGVKAAARSSDEAARGVNDISGNIQSISAASQQTAENASRTSGSSKTLAEIAAALAQIVSRFKLN